MEETPLVGGGDSTRGVPDNVRVVLLAPVVSLILHHLRDETVAVAWIGTDLAVDRS